MHNARPFDGWPVRPAPAGPKKPPHEVLTVPEGLYDVRLPRALWCGGNGTQALRPIPTIFDSVRR